MEFNGRLYRNIPVTRIKVEFTIQIRLRTTVLLKVFQFVTMKYLPVRDAGKQLGVSR